jgi:hypothetical protein
MKVHAVMALMLDNRYQEAAKVQDVLTKNGCIINARLGLHEVGDECAANGLILLHLYGTQGEVDTLSSDLQGIAGVKAKTLELDYQK